MGSIIICPWTSESPVMRLFSSTFPIEKLTDSFGVLRRRRRG